MTDYKITLEVTRRVTFDLTRDLTVAAAVQHVMDRFEDGGIPDDEDIPSVEVSQVTTDGHEISLTYTIDWDGPKNARGLRRWVCHAYSGSKLLAKGYDTAEVVEAALLTLRGRTVAS